jgi:hypothetical protein
MSEPEKLTDEELLLRLTEALEGWPLYRELKYTGAPGVRRVPTEIKLFCSDCGTMQQSYTRFDPNSEHSNKNFHYPKIYLCKNCNKQRVMYYFRWFEENGATTFVKIGQYPELEDRVPAALKAILNDDDQRFYRKALKSRNANYGLGAVAYLRRVVESRMNDMLTVLHADASEHGVSDQLLADLEHVKQRGRYSDKVEYASKLAPGHLFPPNQPNPFGILLETTSDGIHGYSDSECIDLFDQCRTIFEYVFGSLRARTEDQKTFVKDLAKLAETRAARRVPKVPRQPTGD